MANLNGDKWRAALHCLEQVAADALVQADHELAQLRESQERREREIARLREVLMIAAVPLEALRSQSNPAYMAPEVNQAIYEATERIRAWLMDPESSVQRSDLEREITPSGPHIVLNAHAIAVADARIAEAELMLSLHDCTIVRLRLAALRAERAALEHQGDRFRSRIRP